MAGVYALFNSSHASKVAVNTGSTDQVLGHIVAPTGQGVRPLNLEVIFYGLAAGDAPTVRLAPLSAVGSGGTSNPPLKTNSGTDATNLTVQTTGKVASYGTPPTIDVLYAGLDFPIAGSSVSRSFQGDLNLLAGGKAMGIVVNANGMTTGSVTCVFSLLIEE